MNGGDMITREQKDGLISSMSYLIIEVLELFTERDILLNLKAEHEEAKIEPCKYKINEQYEKCFKLLGDIKQQLANTRS